MRANAARENRTPADRLTFDNRKGNDMPKECEKSDGSGGGYACWAYWKDTIVISDYVFTPDYQKGTPSDKGHSTLMAFDKTAPLELAFQETIIHEITHVFADARPQSVGRYSAWALCTNCSQEERMAQSFSVYIANNGVSVPGFDDRFDFVETYRHLWFSNPFPHGLPHT